MIEAVAIVLISCVLAAGVYWHIRFRQVLPLEKRLSSDKVESARLVNFFRELSKSTQIPVSLDYFIDISQQALTKLCRLFPGSNIWLFEMAGSLPSASGEGLPGPDKSADAGLQDGCDWKLVNQTGVHGEGLTFASMNIYKGEFLDRAVRSGEMEYTEVADFDINDQILSLLRARGIKSVLACPCMKEKGVCHGVVVFVCCDSVKFETVRPYLEIICNHLTSLYSTTCEVLKLKKEGERLKDELGVAIQELDTTGSRLIQRARERKALYEVVSTVTTKAYNPQTGYSAILTLLARIMEADVTACMLIDEEKKELVTQMGAYGVADDESMQYRIPLSNRVSSSVKAFLSKKPFITGDAQNDPEVIARYAKLWNVRSMMVVPVILHDKAIGILRVGSLKTNYFTQDQLEFLCLIAEEMAVIIDGIALHEKLARTAEELAQLNRMKDEFISTVSHEFKTPLTAIRGFISVILSGDAGKLTGQQKRFLEISEQAVNRLARLISELLDISRLDGKVEMELKTVSIEDLLQEAVESFTFRTQEKGVHLFLSFNGPLPPVHADPKWIVQVIDNLLSNAVKFTGKGGKISVSGLAKNNMVKICVSDTGHGIQLEDQKHVFEKFYRARHWAHGRSQDLQTGTGLGLAISKSIVEKHNGRIWVESKPGEGSRFYFSLPVAKEQGTSLKE